MLLPFSNVCCASHDEARPYLYSTPRFAIHQVDLILSLPPNISNVSRLDFEISFYRFPQITLNTHSDISMPKWKSICGSLGSMPNLSDLRVTLRQVYLFVSIRGTADVTELVVGVLRPLKNIDVKGGKEHFTVRIEWRLTEEERAGLGDSPFRVEEIGEREPNGNRWYNNPSFSLPDCIG